jgi:hypothetical protein
MMSRLFIVNLSHRLIQDAGNCTRRLRKSNSIEFSRNFGKPAAELEVELYFLCCPTIADLSMNESGRTGMLKLTTARSIGLFPSCCVNQAKMSSDESPVYGIEIAVVIVFIGQ